MLSAKPRNGLNGDMYAFETKKIISTDNLK